MPLCFPLISLAQVKSVIHKLCARNSCPGPNAPVLFWTKKKIATEDRYPQTTKRLYYLNELPIMNRVFRQQLKWKRQNRLRISKTHWTKCDRSPPYQFTSFYWSIYQLINKMAKNAKNIGAIHTPAISCQITELLFYNTIDARMKWKLHAP